MAIYYVPDDYSTITAGIGALSSGDTLYIKEGSYSESGQVTINASGSSGSPITVYGLGRVVWDRGDANENIVQMASNQDVSWWNWHNLTVEGRFILGWNVAEHRVLNMSFQGMTFRDNALGGFRILRGENIDILNCLFHDIRSGEAGVDTNAVNLSGYTGTNSSARNILIRGCTFRDIGSDGIHIGGNGNNVHNVTILESSFYTTLGARPVGENGIDIKGCAGPILIDRCKVWSFRATQAGQDCSGSSGEGIIMHEQYGGGPSSQNVTVKRTEISDCDVGIKAINGVGNILIVNNKLLNMHVDAGDADTGSSVILYDEPEVTIYHNTSTGSRYHIRGYNTTVDLTLKNNIFVDGGFSIPSPYDTWTIDSDYNGYDNVSVPPAISGGNDMEGNFGLNLRGNLTEGSDAICAALTSVGVSDDFYGQPRGADPDLGASEFFLPGRKVMAGYRR